MINRFLNGACSTVRLRLHISNTAIPILIYFACLHSIIEYEIFFRGNWSNGGKMLTLHKRSVRIMVGAKPRISSGSLIKKLETLPFPCQYEFSIMNFIINNQEYFKARSSVHCINTRNKHNLHRTLYFQTSACYAGLEIFKFTTFLTNVRNEKA